MASEKKRVLVVDDDNELLETVRAALVTRGYDVVVAHDGAEALSRAELHRPDLMLLDLILPRRNGFAVLEGMRRSGMHGTPVIMMTGTDDQKHRDTAALRGVSAFLCKPFAMEQLLSAVDTVLNA